MLAEGIRLMAVGMITVFAFLSILVAVMSLQARFFSAFADRFPDAEPTGTDEPADDGAELALAIAVAHAKRLGRSV